MAALAKRRAAPNLPDSPMSQFMAQNPGMSIQDIAKYTSANKLPGELEEKFQTDLQFAPGWSDWRKGFVKNVGQNPNTEPGGDYNYRMAWLAGETPKLDPGTGEYHGNSVTTVPPANPIELKAENHPTAWKQKYMERFQTNPDIDIREGKMTDERARFINNSLRSATMFSPSGKK